MASLLRSIPLPLSISLFLFLCSSASAQLYVVDPGDVGVGTDSPTSKLHVAGDVFLDGSGTKDILVQDGTIYFQRDSVVSRIIQNGGRSLYFSTGTSPGSWSDTLKLYTDGDAEVTGVLTHSSDIRKKKNIQPLRGALEKITSLRGISYEIVGRAGHDQTIGLAAQEVEKVFPELVNTNEEGFKSVAYAHLVAPLIEAVKEQQEHINRTVQENQRLLSRLEQLEKQQLALTEKLASSKLAKIVSGN